MMALSKSDGSFVLIANNTIRWFAATTFNYPTMAEANKYVAGEWKRAHQPHGLLQWVRRYHDWKRG